MGMCPHCRTSRIGPVRTLLSHGGYPVACGQCNRYSYLPAAEIVGYVTNGLGVAALGLAFVLQSCWLVAACALAACIRVLWLAFGKRMLAVDPGEVKARHFAAWFVIGLVIVVVAIGLQLGFR